MILLLSSSSGATLVVQILRAPGKKRGLKSKQINRDYHETTNDRVDHLISPSVHEKVHVLRHIAMWSGSPYPGIGDNVIGPDRKSIQPSTSMEYKTFSIGFRSLLLTQILAFQFRIEIRG